MHNMKYGSDRTEHNCISAHINLVFARSYYTSAFKYDWQDLSELLCHEDFIIIMISNISESLPKEMGGEEMEWLGVSNVDFSCVPDKEATV